MWLKISLGLNLALAGGLAGVWLTRTPLAPVPSATPSAAPLTKVVAAPLNLNTNPPAAESKPFRWSQLDAKDYHGYVKNLRAIGCPEPTVRAIVTADVHAAFRQYGRELEKQLASLPLASWSTRLTNPNAEQLLKNRLQQLSLDEAAKTDELLGLNPAVKPGAELAANRDQSAGGVKSQDANGVTQSRLVQTNTVRVSAAGVVGNNAVSEGAESEQVNAVTMPLVMHDIDLRALNLDSSQLQAVNELRQQFVDKIGGVNQNPEDPAYMNNWQQAQSQIDDIMKGYLGVEAWQNYQMQVYANDYAKAHPEYGPAPVYNLVP